MLRWELWAGFLIQALFIGAWVASVAAGPDGRRHLEIFFIDNLLGRFISDTATLERVGRWFSEGYSSRMAYNEGHVNWFGKYLVELPAFVMPWLFLAAVAAWRSLTILRTRITDGTVQAERSAWRFAWSILVPNVLLLTVAGTARGIYLAPVLTGCALLVGLWAAHQPDEKRPLDRHAVSATALLLAGLAALLLPAVLVVTQVKRIPVPMEAIILCGAASVLGAVKLLVIISHLRARRTGDVAREMVITLIALWLLVGLAAPKVVDHWQDLGPVMRRAVAVAKGHRLVLMNSDETTRAAMYWHGGVSAPWTDNDTEVIGRPDCIALRKMPSRDGDHAAHVAELKTKGWLLVERIDIPMGRRYALFASRDIAEGSSPP